MTIHTLRAVLATGAGLAGVVAAVTGQWLAAVVLGIALAVHCCYTVVAHRRAG